MGSVEAKKPLREFFGRGVDRPTMVGASHAPDFGVLWPAAQDPLRMSRGNIVILGTVNQQDRRFALTKHGFRRNLPHVEAVFVLRPEERD